MLISTRSHKTNPKDVLVKPYLYKYLLIVVRSFLLLWGTCSIGAADAFCTARRSRSGAFLVGQVLQSEGCGIRINSRSRLRNCTLDSIMEVTGNFVLSKGLFFTSKCERYTYTRRFMSLRLYFYTDRMSKASR
jgi:hypothetical protein